MSWDYLISDLFFELCAVSFTAKEFTVDPKDDLGPEMSSVCISTIPCLTQFFDDDFSGQVPSPGKSMFPESGMAAYLESGWAAASYIS